MTAMKQQVNQQKGVKQGEVIAYRAAYEHCLSFSSMWVWPSQVSFCMLAAKTGLKYNHC